MVHVLLSSLAWLSQWSHLCVGTHAQTDIDTLQIRAINAPAVRQVCCRSGHLSPPSSRLPDSVSPPLKCLFTFVWRQFDTSEEVLFVISLGLIVNVGL